MRKPVTRAPVDPGLLRPAPASDPTDCVDVRAGLRRLAADLLHLAERRLNGDPEAGVAALDPNTLGWTDLCRLMETAQMLERLALGAPTRIVEQRIRGEGS